jgi:hypothetical protein
MRRLWVGLQWLLGLVVVFFVVRSVASNWGQIQSSEARVHLDAGALAAAAGIVLCSYAALISAWRAVLAGWGERLRYPMAARVWCVSNLARYVPGKVWQIAGMAALAQRAGVSPWAAAGSAVIVQLVSIATGALITGLAAPQWKEHPLLLAGCGIVAGAAAAILAWGKGTRVLSRWIGGMLGRQLDLAPVGKEALLLAAAVTTLAWLAQGLALYLCALGLLGRTALTIWPAVGIFTGGYLAGLIAVFTPGGLGVREGVLLLWLTPPLGLKGAIVVSVGSRLLLTATELLAAAITVPLRTQSADATS